MTGTHPDDRRIVADGGETTVTRTAVAEGVVTREVDGEDTEMIRVPISSTRPDREGDRFDKAALEEMADQIAVTNPMVFDNHGLAGGFMEAIPYDARETIGAQMDAEVESSEDGEHDLYAFVNPDGTHEEGERMARQVSEEGQPIKFSVGFRVKGYDERAEVESDYEGDGRVFTAADLMETSRVGIPANPDASVTQSVAAKDLPGYANHPLVQLMAGEGSEPDETFAAKDATPTDTHEGGSCDADADCPDGKVCQDGECVDESEASASVAQVNALGDEVAELRELVETLADDDDEDGDDDDDDDEEDSGDASEAEESTADLPDDVADAIEERRQAEADLRAEIDELREGGLERGESKTGDVDATRDARPDETDADDGTDADDDESGEKTAMDVARGS